MLKLNHTLAQLSSVSFLLKGENRFSHQLSVSKLKTFREVAEHFCKGSRERGTFDSLLPRTKSRTFKAIKHFNQNVKTA